MALLGVQKPGRFTKTSLGKSLSHELPHSLEGAVTAAAISDVTTPTRRAVGRTFAWTNAERHKEGARRHR